MNTETEIYKSERQKTAHLDHPLSKFLIAVFEFQIALKMYHFQTFKYAAHKTIDEYSEKLAEKMDKFFEVGQGIYGRINLDDQNNAAIYVNNVRDNNFSLYIKKFLHEVSSIEKIISRHSDLCNIKDEIKADLNQLIYLLTFQ
jgi:hypothetical protein